MRNISLSSEQLRENKTFFKKNSLQMKKKVDKAYNLLKKYIPLHCFNKQLIVLQI